MAEQTAAQVEYYSDLLCVWAWIAQPRLEEVLVDWQTRVSLQPRCIDVFGDAHEKIRSKWGREDGFERFANHLHEAAAGHPHARLHDGLWRTVRPTSSLPGHLHLKAAEAIASPAQALAYAAALREAFFVNGEDIARGDVLVRVARDKGLDAAGLQAEIDSGRAQAALAADLHQARSERIAGSPTWVMNGGRQVLYGNVGYRIIRANLEALLREDPGGASWC